MKQSNCPILESLTLAISVYTEPFRLPRVFRDALLLSSVNFIDCRESDALLQIPGLPWENIRRVQTNQRDTASLRYMQNNRDFQDGILVLNATNQTSNYYTHSPRACPLSITTLILDRPWAYALCQFLRYVSIPTLEALTIIFRDPENTHPRCFNPLLSLPLFLGHTRRRLNMFSLIMYGWYNDNEWEPTLANSLVDALHEMGHLKSLQVIESNNGPPLLSKRLFEELSADALLPGLTSLELVWAESRQPDEELLSALSLRADGRLSSVVLGIRNGGNLGPDVLECMRSLRKSNVRAMCW
ncbi:hypothetical protein CPB85DRAFT_667518 [Mucidula mucida]|nr:hypothetical protein CPB85DRAFT_667518 [Mucidula mucida]